MDRPQITESVVRDLARHRSHNDIILSVCRMTGMDWKAAEAFVRQVENSQRQTIATRRAPLILILAGIGILGGLSTIISVGSATLDGRVVPFLFLPIPYLGNAIYFGFGILAVAGGLIGLITVARDIT